MMRTVRTFVCCAGLLSIGFLALGCHTTEGFGRDLQSGGSKISEEAREHSYR